MSDDQKQRWRTMVQDQLAASATDAADRVKIQATIAADAMKALLLANGGAMIALFTFVGNVLAKAPSVRFDFHDLRWSFGLFVSGFVVALITHVFAFFSQDRFFHQAIAEVERLTQSVLTDERVTDQTAERRAFKQGQTAYLLGLGAAIVSVLMFAVGCGFALSGVLIG